MAVNLALYSSHEKIRSISYQISDYSAVDRVEISAEEVLHLSQADQEAARINPDMLVAVVGKQDLMFGLLRMWELYAGASKMQACVFRDVEQARDWIRQQRQGADGQSN